MLQENETAENAFSRLLPAYGNCSAYHARLQAMLKAQEKLKAINDARKSDVSDEEPSKELENDPQLLGEAKSAMQDVHDMKDKSDDLYVLLTSFAQELVVISTKHQRVWLNIDVMRTQILAELRFSLHTSQTVVICMAIAAIFNTSRTISAIQKQLDIIFL